MTARASGRAARERRSTSINLFLDTNIYLSFYKLSDDDLEELKKLSVTVKSGTTVLYLTDQVRGEFQRNREKTISDSLASLEAVRLPKSFPRLFTNLDGYVELRMTIAKLEQQLANLLSDARNAAMEKRLSADELIEELFSLATPLPTTPAIWAAARIRHEIGNPPGKADSYGDAVNWESLLVGVPDGGELVLVTADKDYMSGLDRTVLDGFLRAEWESRKQTSVVAYSSLAALFKRHYPDIRLAVELEKELAIDSLIGSQDFRSTHAAILKLSQFGDFSREQAAALAEAGIANGQVQRILGDDDVRSFFIDIVGRHSDGIDPEIVRGLNEGMSPTA